MQEMLKCMYFDYVGSEVKTEVLSHCAISLCLAESPLITFYDFQECQTPASGNLGGSSNTTITSVAAAALTVVLAAAACRADATDSDSTTTNSAVARTTATTVYLIINSTLPQTSFDVCWLEPINAGLQWSTLVGCALILYCFSFSVRGQTLWVVLLVHALYNPLAWALAVNEVNWVLHESSTVYYSYVKTMVVIRSGTLKKILKILLILIFAGFVGCRANIGRLRYMYNQLMNDDIELAHNYAFLVWSAADLMLMVLLALNVVDYAKKKIEATKDGIHMVQTLLSSSIPRFAVIFANTIITSGGSSSDQSRAGSIPLRQNASQSSRHAHSTSSVILMPEGVLPAAEVSTTAPESDIRKPKAAPAASFVPVAPPPAPGAHRSRGRRDSTTAPESVADTAGYFGYAAASGSAAGRQWAYPPIAQQGLPVRDGLTRWDSLSEGSAGSVVTAASGGELFTPKLPVPGRW
ncbi:hypothetical protein DFJ73DRAFT_785589 [Zopfochytrium polystomum]|nr:hypothetical protein DFJ73DRAFT_785589 [Zopfochytrium polystomum]